LDIIFRWYKRKFYRVPVEDFFKYDLIRDYRRKPTDLEYEMGVERQIMDFERKRQQEGATKRKILRSASNAVY
jgi:hypothetical protein